MLVYIISTQFLTRNNFESFRSRGIVKITLPITGLQKLLYPSRVCENNPRDFKDLSKVGYGGFSLVYAAEWKNTGTKYAIKKFTKASTNEIINEVCNFVVCYLNFSYG